MIYKLKEELASCSSEILELKQSSIRLSVDQEIESKRKLNQMAEDANRDKR